jgi:hypothetical protein
MQPAYDPERLSCHPHVRLYASGNVGVAQRSIVSVTIYIGGYASCTGTTTRSDPRPTFGTSKSIIIGPRPRSRPFLNAWVASLILRTGQPDARRRRGADARHRASVGFEMRM